ncbi:hypothetical protein AB1N83_008558 [Pleurotus pulmonarius]
MKTSIDAKSTRGTGSRRTPPKGSSSPYAYGREHLINREVHRYRRRRWARQQGLTTAVLQLVVLFSPSGEYDITRAIVNVSSRRCLGYGKVHCLLIHVEPHSDSPKQFKV